MYIILLTFHTFQSGNDISTIENIESLRTIQVCIYIAVISICVYSFTRRNTFQTSLMSNN